jgi:hypothetical protein
LSAKWLELLKQIAPSVTRAAVLRDPAVTSGIGQFAVIQSVAPSFGLINFHNADEIERAVTAFARTANGGLVVTAGGLSTAHRKLIIGLAARHKLPAVYYRRLHVVDGGLPSAKLEPGQRTGKFRLGGDQLLVDANGESRISVQDYAVAMIDELERPAHIRQPFTVGY